jgi:hypothetical protein
LYKRLFSSKRGENEVAINIGEVSCIHEFPEHFDAFRYNWRHSLFSGCWRTAAGRILLTWMGADLRCGVDATHVKLKQ